MEAQVVPPEVDVDTSVLENMEFEIACDVSKLRAQLEAAGLPPCKDEPAQWIGLRPNCCASSPRYRLLCDFCRKVYLNWQAKQAAISCPHCGTVTGGFLDFIPLHKKA